MKPLAPAELPNLPPEDLEILSAGVETQMGLHFPPARWRDMLKGIAQAAKPMGFDSVDTCLRAMRAGPLSLAQIQILAAELTIGETYFLREKATLDVLEHKVLPEIVRKRTGKRQHLKIWSAGCSTGEEAYTLAAIVDRVLPSRHGWDVQVLATDANIVSLEKARAGLYREWSFRGTPEEFRERYFRAVDAHTLAVIPKIKELVRFAYLNLVEDPFPSLQTNTCDVDIIFCRNVLMYFRRQIVLDVVEKFHNCLNDQGWLAVSLCETSTELYRDFAGFSFPGATLYRKARPHESAPAAYPRPGEAPSTPPRAFDRPGLPQRPRSASATEKSGAGALVRQGGALASHGGDRPAPERASLGQAMETARERYAQGAYERAARTLTEALADSAAPSVDTSLKALAHGLAARSLANLGRLDEALKFCEAAVSLDVVNAPLRYLLATILLGLGRTEDARKSLGAVLFLDGDNILANYTLGVIASAQGQAEQAKRHFHNTLALVAPLAEDHVLEDSGELTAGQLAGIIRSTMGENRS